MIDLASRVDAVTVFRRGALVERVGTLRPDNECWPEQVRLAGLPLALDDRSLQVALAYPQGGGGLVACDVTLDSDFRRDEVKLVEEDLEPYRRQLRRLEMRRRQLRDDIAQLTKLEVPGRPEPNPQGQRAPYSLGACRALVELRQQRLAELSNLSLELDAEVAQLSEQMRAREAEMHQQRQRAKQPWQLHKAAIIRLQQLGPVTAPSVEIRLSYRVDGARWVPAYTVRFDRDVTLASLSMRAVLAQSSGEDWQGVRLAVSTSDPTSWKELPELASRRIGRSQPSSSRKGWRPPPLGTEALFGDYDRGPDLLPPATVPRPVAPASEIFAVPQGALVLDTDDGELETLVAPPSEPTPGAVGMRLRSMAEPESERAAESPLRKAMPMVQSRLGGSFDRAAPAPVAMASPRAFGGGGAPAGGRGGGTGSLAPRALVPPQLEVGQEHLSYGLLRMAGADETRRGRLVALQPLELCLRLWRERHPDSSAQPEAAIRAELQRAQRALELAPPPEHRFPHSVEGFDYLYRGESRVDVPSDARFHSLPLFEGPLTAQLQWVSVPRLSQEVFRQVQVDCLADLALPCGPVDVFVGPDYILTTQFSDVVPGGNVTIGLGVEQGVKVTRNTHFKESSAGMMGGTLQLRHQIDIEVANRLAREVRVEVRETIPRPASDSDEVKVKIENCQPAWEKNPRGEGYRWTVRVPAGEKAALSAAYIVELASKNELIGGNRREA